MIRLASHAPSRHAQILIVDDDPIVVQMLGRILGDRAQLRFATDGATALALARERAPDLVLLDAEMPKMSGFQVCEALRDDAALADVPVIFVTAHDDPAFELAGFAIGAVDFIAKPFSAPVVQARVATHLRLKRATDELRRLSMVDVLTGIANRRRFDDALDREWRRARRSAAPLALLLCDVDHFKAFNDGYGHPAGDVCLQNVAAVLAAALLRPGDLIARWDGEEFAVLLPETPRAAAEHVAQRLLGAVEALDIEHRGSPVARHVTVSIGMTCYDDDSACWRDAPARARGTSPTPADADDIGPADLVEAADSALYAAKERGRARAMVLELADPAAEARPVDASRWTPLAA